MNKMNLILALLLTTLTVTPANAVSAISGVTPDSGGSGTFNINPLSANGSTGYRYYDKFLLSEGDVANLVFAMNNGDTRSIKTFINIVGDAYHSKAVINGILNSVDKNGNFYNGNVIFLTQDNFEVGQNGVINVGQLSVLHPVGYNSWLYRNRPGDNYVEKSTYTNEQLAIINNINKLRNNTGTGDGQNNNYYGGGNLSITQSHVNGLIIARNGVDIRGFVLNVGNNGKIVNGYKGDNVFTDYNTANNVFNSLVNTNGIIASADKINADGGKIVLKSSGGYLQVSGTVANLANNEVALTNHGNIGLTLSGSIIASNGNVNIYNPTTTQSLNMTISDNSKIYAKNGKVNISSKNGADIQSGVTINAKDVDISSKDKVLRIGANVIASNTLKIKNTGSTDGAGMVISGTLFGGGTGKIAIQNENGTMQLTDTGKINNAKTVLFKNTNADTMNIDGEIKASNGVKIGSKSILNLNGKVSVTGNGDLGIVSNGKITAADTSELSVKNGKLAIHSKSGGAEFLGAITNLNGETSIKHSGSSSMTVGGTINNNGNLAIVNKSGAVTVSGDINNTGTTKIMNYAKANDTNGMTISGNVVNTGKTSSDRLQVYNDRGNLTINGKLENKTIGNLLVTGKANSTGVSVSGTISNENGKLAIINQGATSSGTGMKLLSSASISNENGDTAINNYAGDASISSDITVKNSNLGIINRGRTAGSGTNMVLNANITSTGNKKVNIGNYGSGKLDLGGTVNHDGRLNVIANEGNLNLYGTVNNTGHDMSYFAARENGTGINVSNTFHGNTTNGGTMLIKNISGAENGLTYAGQMKSTNGGQIEVYNMQGDLNVTSAAKMEGGEPTVILNKGDGMTIDDNATLTGDLIIVNKGGQHAIVPAKYQQNFHEQLKN